MTAREETSPVAVTPRRARAARARFDRSRPRARERRRRRHGEYILAGIFGCLLSVSASLAFIGVLYVLTPRDSSAARAADPRSQVARISPSEPKVLQPGRLATPGNKRETQHRAHAGVGQR